MEQIRSGIVLSPEMALVSALHHTGLPVWEMRGWIARMGFLHEGVGEEFSIQPVLLMNPDAAALRAMVNNLTKLQREITRRRNQLRQIAAATFPELKTLFKDQRLPRRHLAVRLGSRRAATASQMLMRRLEGGTVDYHSAGLVLQTPGQKATGAEHILPASVIRSLLM